MLNCIFEDKSERKSTALQCTGCAEISRACRLGVHPDGTKRDVEKVVLFDAFDPVEAPPEDPRVEIVTGDICDRATVDKLIDGATDSVFHFAAVVSGGAGADFDLGYVISFIDGQVK